MNSSESLKEIAPAMTAAQAEFKGVGKSGYNSHDRYNYANLDDYVRTVQPVLKKHGLSILTSVDEIQPLENRPTRNDGIQYAIRVKLTIRVQHTSGEWIETQAWGEGQDRADKGIYKAITGARKYALASALGLATIDDPEADEGVGDAPPPAAKGKPADPPKRTEPPDGDPLEEFPEFRKQLSAAFKSRAFSPAAQKAAVDSVVKKLKIGKLEKSSVKQRRAIIDSVNDGKADEYKFASVPATQEGEAA